MANAGNEEGETFDVEGMITSYREVIRERDAAETELGRADFDSIAKRMRRKWKEWQGEDSLHEMAFGEIADE